MKQALAAQGFLSASWYPLVIGCRATNLVRISIFCIWLTSFFISIHNPLPLPSSSSVVPLPLQWPLLLPDHCHPSVLAGFAMLTDPSHRHPGVHPRLRRGQQRTQRAGFFSGHRPAAQPWTRAHCQSLTVSPPVIVCLCGRNKRSEKNNTGWKGKGEYEKRGQCGRGQRMTD